MFLPLASIARDVPVVQPGVATFMFLYRQKTKLKVFLPWAELKGQCPWAQQCIRGLSQLKESIVILFLTGVRRVGSGGRDARLMSLVG